MKKICEEYGIGLRTQKSAEYEHVSVVSAHDKEKSWTERIKQRVDTVLESATSYADFEKQLEERGISCFAQNLRQQVLRQPAIAPEPIKGSRAPVSAPIQVNTPDKKQEALNEQKQAIFNDTREKLREAASQEEVERIKREEELKQELVDREKEIQAKQEVDHKRRMALLRRGLER